MREDMKKGVQRQDEGQSVGKMELDGLQSGVRGDVQE